jgi:hypothetical protein
MLSPAFHNAVFQNAGVPVGADHPVLSYPAPNRPVPAGRQTPVTGSERLQDPIRQEPVRLGVVLSELAACYGLSEEPSPSADVVNLSPQTVTFAQAGLLPAMV